MLTIAQVRRAAATLREQNQLITAAALAASIGCDKVQVRGFVNGITGLKQEVGLYAGGTFTGGEYEEAAARLAQKVTPITIETLASETGKSYSNVRAFFSRYPSLRRKIGVLTELERKRIERQQKYESAICALHQKRLQITIRAIARACNEDAGVTCRNFKDNFNLEQLVKEVLDRTERETTDG